jgi:uncharacterized DUF497 family protein
VRIKRFEWDNVNIRHIARHNVEIEEAEEALIQSLYMRKTRQGRYIAYGQTTTGRYLTVIFEPRGQSTVRVITAREMTAKEMRNYRKQSRR